VTRYDKSRIKILSDGNEVADINHNDKQMEDIMSNIVLTPAFVNLVKADGAADTASKKKRGALIDHAMEIGVDFTKNTMSPEQINETLDLITLRFPKDARALLKLGAAKADGKIAADHDGSRFNSQGRAKNWNFWNSKRKRILKDLADAVIARKRKEARVASGGNQTRSLIERLAEETNKLFNAVIAADADKLPDSFDVDTVLKDFEALSKSAGFTLVRKAD
jgi:hypothetical protein